MPCFFLYVVFGKQDNLSIFSGKNIVVNGEVAEWSNAAVSKTVTRRMSGREFESLPLRQLSLTENLHNAKRKFSQFLEKAGGMPLKPNRLQGLRPILLRAFGMALIVPYLLSVFSQDPETFLIY